jgi:hypothetical protein
MKNKFFTCILFALISLTSVGQDIVFPDLEGFKKLTKYPVYLPDNLWDFINGAADGFLALGFQDLHVAEYKKGKNVIKLEIYRHQNHTMAFGIYASERSPSFNFTNLGAQGYSIDGATNFFKGNYYVKIRTYSEKAKVLQAAGSLAQRVANMLPGETVMPALLARFPSEGKKINEETYINDNVLGHQFLSSAFQAQYGIGNDSFSIYLIRKETAAEILEMARTYLAAAGLESFLTDENRFVFNDGYNGTVFLSWRDNTMAIISGLAKDQADIAYKYTLEILK